MAREHVAEMFRLEPLDDVGAAEVGAPTVAGDGPGVHAAMLKWIEKKPTRTTTRTKTPRKTAARSRSATK